MIPQEEIERLKQLCKAATPGPWQYEVLKCINTLGYGDEGPCWILDLPLATAEQDGPFIAAAREALPAVLAELVELRRLLKDRDIYNLLAHGYTQVRNFRAINELTVLSRELREQEKGVRDG